MVFPDHTHLLFWTQIRPDKTSGLLRIQTVWHWLMVFPNEFFEEKISSGQKSKKIYPLVGKEFIYTNGYKTMSFNYLPASGDDGLCEQFGSRSGPTHQFLSISEPFDPLMVFLKYRIFYDMDNTESFTNVAKVLMAYPNPKSGSQWSNLACRAPPPPPQDKFSWVPNCYLWPPRCETRPSSNINVFGLGENAWITWQPIADSRMGCAYEITHISSLLILDY